MATETPGPRILIVDDQKSNVRLLEQTLRRAGFSEVTSTVEPRDVADLHRQNHYDLILLDLQMPLMNGFQVMEQLQKTAGADRLKILVLSADASQASAALEAGANSFFGKPFRLPDVVDRVRLVLSAGAPETAAGAAVAAKP
jgi:CheY-like chemotaxis protein